MSDHKADKTTEATPAAAATAQKHPEPQTATLPAATPPAAEHGGAALTDLMAHGDKGKAAADKRGPDLEQQALRAAEQALAEGERALAAARAQLHDDKAPAQQARSRRRELALRVLLVVNVLAMLVVAMLPAPGAGQVQPEPHAVDTKHGTEHMAVPAAPRTDELWNRAIAASGRRDFAGAVALLERYLEESPRMAPSQQMSVFLALSHYAANSGDFKKAQDYERKSRALDQSHSLPEDLVAMAKAAVENGDQESLRRVWARFLLQQRQIPSSLYQHVATAYLQLGDSYRQQANAAAEQARLAELKAIEARLREEALKGRGEPK